MDRGIMSKLTFTKVLENIRENKDFIKVIVLYHGGEPLLNKDFFKYISDIKNISSDFFIKTVSNGMAITKDNALRLLNSRLDLIEFSLDGASSEESDYVRVKSKAGLIIENIKYLIEKKSEMGNESLAVTIATTQFHRDGTSPPINSAQIPNWLQDIFGDKVSYKSSYATRWPHMGNTDKFEYYQSLGIDKNDCDHIISTITVRSDGAVVPCCYDLTSKLIMGNIHNESLRNIWSNSKYHDLRESVDTKQFLSICASCATVRPPVFLIPKWSTPVNKLP